MRTRRRRGWALALILVAALLGALLGVYTTAGAAQSWTTVANGTSRIYDNDDNYTDWIEVSLDGETKPITDGIKLEIETTLNGTYDVSYYISCWKPDGLSTKSVNKDMSITGSKTIDLTTFAAGTNEGCEFSVEVYRWEGTADKDGKLTVRVKALQ